MTFDDLRTVPFWRILTWGVVSAAAVFAIGLGSDLNLEPERLSFGLFVGIVLAIFGFRAAGTIVSGVANVLRRTRLPVQIDGIGNVLTGAAILSAAILVYMLSIGPAYRLMRNGRIGKTAFDRTYGPVIWLHDTSALKMSIEGYVKLWEIR